MQCSEKGCSGSSGEQLEATLSVFDPTHTQYIDQEVKPVHQEVAEECTLRKTNTHEYDSLNEIQSLYSDITMTSWLNNITGW